jgi:Ca2+/Na+ antiporter
MQVKQQCYILGASVLVPVTIMVMGFNLFSAVLGVLFYIGFLIYSLQRGEPSRPEEEKDEDIEAISTSLSLFLVWPVCFSLVVAYIW